MCIRDSNLVKMAEKNKSANLCESVEESILNVMQDNLISTNENIDESVQLELPNVNGTCLLYTSRCV